MKKILSILLCGILLTTLTACGAKNENNDDNKNNDAKASIITNSGIKESLSAKELMKIYDENQAKFNRDYKGAEITFTGTIKAIETQRSVLIDDIVTKQNRIIFDEGWCLILGASNTDSYLADYNKGDKLEVVTGIYNARDLDTNALKQLIDERVVWLIGNDQIYYDKDYTNIKTKITKK